MNVRIIIFNCQKCVPEKCLKGHMSLGSPCQGVLSISFSLSWSFCWAWSCPYLLFVILCTPTHVKARKKYAKKVRNYAEKFATKQRLSTLESICYLEGCIWYWYKVNQQTSHNIRKCFNILWINFT